MLENRNLTISNQQIAWAIWGNESASDESIRKIIDRLRKKLDDIGFNGAEIVNYRNMGYRFQTSGGV
jgi:DNA-binding response OmpR family regulator